MYSVFAALSDAGEYPYTWGTGSPEVTEELHCGHFAGHSVVLGDRSWVRNTSDHLEVVAQGDEEGTVESAPGEL